MESSTLGRLGRQAVLIVSRSVCVCGGGGGVRACACLRVCVCVCVRVRECVSVCTGGGGGGGGGHAECPSDKVSEKNWIRVLIVWPKLALLRSLPVSSRRHCWKFPPVALANY